MTEADSILREVEAIGRERIAYADAQDYLDMAEYPHAMILNPGPNISRKPGIFRSCRRLVLWTLSLLLIYAVLGMAAWMVWRWL